MNLTALIGNVASEPELRSTSSGRAVCTFRLAVSRPGGTSADFFTIVTWEKQADICRQYLHIGRRIGVEGRLHHSTWEHEGSRRSKVEVIAHRVQLLGARRVEPDADAAELSGGVDGDELRDDFAPVGDGDREESDALASV